MAVSRTLRRLFPSVARLTYNPLFRVAVNAADWPSRLAFPEFSSLPPNHLRIRVGVGNRFLFNQFLYLVGPKNYWMYVFANGFCALDSTIVDIGCGCGRYASHLRDLNVGSVRFRGRYYGIDIDSEMLEWCRGNFDSERFSFLQATGRSRAYNRPEEADSPYQLPLPNESVDFVFSTSLFTHLLERDLVNYVQETHRLLRRGGFTLHSFFSLEHPPSTFGGRHTFRGRIGEAYVESQRQPEAAVAYSESFIRDVLHSSGLSSVAFLASPGQLQPFAIARKP